MVPALLTVLASLPKPWHFLCTLVPAPVLQNPVPLLRGETEALERAFWRTQETELRPEPTLSSAFQPRLPDSSSSGRWPLAAAWEVEFDETQAPLAGAQLWFRT